MLHVVWKNDTSASRSDDTIIPTLELAGLVDENLIVNYRQLFHPGHEILCKPFLHARDPLLILSMRDKALVQRLEKKAGFILRDMALVNGDWEETAWRLLCKNFGFKTSSSTFSQLAKSLPFKILKKDIDKNNIVEALLFGQAGFLEKEIEDPYFMSLKKEYMFQRNKYSLDRRIDEHQWKFLRLRPANFPTIGIAQLASLISKNKNLFSFFIDYSSVNKLKEDIESAQSNYWRTHYKFGKKSKVTIGTLGTSSVNSILINTVAPLLFTYAMHKDNEGLKEKALELLEGIKAELNSIIKKWKESGIEIKSAFDSQAFIELYNEYYLKKRCLSCAIGADIVRSS